MALQGDYERLGLYLQTLPFLSTVQRAWDRTLFVEQTGMRVTISGLEDSWTYNVPTEHLPEGTDSIQLNRAAVNGTWWVRERYYRTVETAAVNRYERSSVMLPPLMANSMDAQPILTTFDEYIRCAVQGNDAYSDLATAEAGGGTPSCYFRITNGDTGGASPVGGFCVSASPLNFDGTNGRDVVLMVWCGNAPSDMYPPDKYLPPPAGDLHAFLCRMTGNYSFAGVEVNGPGEIEGEFLHVSA